MDKEALDYIRQNLEQYEIDYCWHNIGRRLPIPTDIMLKISDLLDEYGEDNDLPEGWWMNYGSIEDIFMEID